MTDILEGAMRKHIADAPRRSVELGMDAVIELDEPRVQLRPARICDCVRAFAEGRRVGCADYCDWRFIADSWLKANRSDHRWRNSPSQIYFTIWRDWLNELVRRKDVKVLVLSDPAKQHRILGWLVYSPAPPLPLPVVHFVFVRDHRNTQLAWRLLAEAGITRASRIVYTCAPKSAKWLARKFAAATHVPMQDFLSPR